MMIWTLWGTRRECEHDMPELMVAWDGYTAQDNFEGWEADCEKARESWGHDLVEWRVIEFEVDERAVFRAFEPPVIKAEHKA